MTRKTEQIRVGIRREDKSIWERRVPIIPQHARELKEKHDIQVVVQPSDIRVFKDEEYTAVGAQVQEELSNCSAVFAVKEVPPSLLISGMTYVFFAHVIKGQPYNMPMLKRLLDQSCALIDYEKVIDEEGRRLIFFGRHAGWAGMLDTLWALGKRLAWEGIPTPFEAVAQAHTYADLETARGAVQEAGERIRSEGLPLTLAPLVVGFAGYGNVSQGAQEIFDLLPFEEVAPSDLAGLFERRSNPHTLYKVVFKEKHMVEPVSPEDHFELQDYYDHPEKYRSRFSTYIPYLTVLVNGIYWEEKYPRLVTKHYLRELFSGPTRPRLRVIGDISCDIEGAIECTVRCTEPGDPVYVYNPLTEETVDGHADEGIVMLAVDILPSELPREASTDFSAILKRFVPAIAKADYTAPFEELDLPPEIKRALIVHSGELTPDYQYLEHYLPT
ncbi:MAG: bifunctional lysine ketoglutarate reductase /saccharopine dehydrogenase family protein [Anaerolineae bacterium]